MESDKRLERLRITAEYALRSLGHGNRNSGYGCRVAATIWIRNRMVAWGVNSAKTSPLQMKYSLGTTHIEPDVFSPIYLHAEISAIARATSLIDPKKLRKARIYVARLKKIPNQRELVWGLAKPCSTCMGAIIEFGFREVCWTLDEDKVERKAYGFVDLR